MPEIQNKENIKTTKLIDMEAVNLKKDQIPLFPEKGLPSSIEAQNVLKEKNLRKDKMSIFLKKKLPSYTETKNESQSKNEISALPEKELPSCVENKGSIKNTAKEKILTLKTLSDQNLLFQTKHLVQKERNITIHVLRHLSEIEFRKLYLKRGFSSLFDYAVKELGYSHSSAYRRIKAMKLCRTVPEVTSKLKSGDLNLTTMSQVQTYFEKQDKKVKAIQKNLNLKNSQKVFENTDKTQSEINKIAPASGCVKTEIPDKTKTDEQEFNLKNSQEVFENTDKTRSEINKIAPAAACVKTEISDKTKTDEQGFNLNQKLDLLEKVTGKSSRQTERLLCESDPEIYQIKEKARYLNKDQVEIKLTLNKNSFDNLERLKSLLSHKNPNMSYGELFKILSELALDKYDPIRKQKRQNQKVSMSHISNTHPQTKHKKIRKKEQDKIQQGEVKNSLNFLFRGNKTVRCQSKPPGNVEEVKQQSKPLGSRFHGNANDEGEKRWRHQSKPLSNVEETRHQSKSLDQVFQNKQSRYIPAQIKRLIWTRDKGQCTYICPQTKKKCGSKHFLQIDHIHPYALGGNSTLNNLRLLCASHNQYRHKLFQ